MRVSLHDAKERFGSNITNRVDELTVHFFVNLHAALHEETLRRLRKAYLKRPELLTMPALVSYRSGFWLCTRDYDNSYLRIMPGKPGEIRAVPELKHPQTRTYAHWPSPWSHFPIESGDLMATLNGIGPALTLEACVDHIVATWLNRI